jgi:CHRD domain
MPTFLRASATLLALGAAGLLSPAWAEQMMFHADLTGAAEVPPVDSAATGTAEVTVDTEAMTVSWTVTAEGLSGDATAAHFHGPATPEESAPPVIDISENWMEGSTEITPEQMQMIQDGMTYLNVHTEANPDGEIRGQVMAAAQ